MAKNADVSRRRFLTGSVAGAAIGSSLVETMKADVPAESRQATGVKVGEVTDTSAIVWMRLTAAASRNGAGRVLPRGAVVALPEDIRSDDLQGACPGSAGRLRLRYGTAADLAGAQTIPWHDAAAEADFVHKVQLTDLRPDTVYHYAAESAGPGGDPAHSPLRGHFRTAPAADSDVPIKFAVVTCFGYKDLDHADGYYVYPSMQRLSPRFFVHTGDNVYFDNDDFVANSVERARHHWHRMHSLPRNVEYCLRTPGYWLKDDHDTLADDCWPGRRVERMAPLSFEDGQAIFRNQVPVGDRLFRSMRWGRNVQIWLTDVRDFRSPNTMADGPNKTIWGREQKEWLLTSLRESRSAYKILINPTPIVGPDRANKSDNHSNAAFRTEGDEFRRLASDISGRFFVVCGDRHWQYHSVHPQTGLHEFSVGAGSDMHAGGTPGRNKTYHRFHRVGGGFLTIGYRPGADGGMTARHHNVMGDVVYEFAIR